MLSANATTNYWRRNALARVRFLQKEQPKKAKRPTVSNDKANVAKQHNKAVKTLRKVRRSYFLERRSFI